MKAGGLVARNAGGVVAGIEAAGAGWTGLGRAVGGIGAGSWGRATTGETERDLRSSSNGTSSSMESDGPADVKARFSSFNFSPILSTEMKMLANQIIPTFALSE